MLHGILYDPYFSHYTLLVAAMHILFGESIPERSLSRANRYLQRFVICLLVSMVSATIMLKSCVYMYIHCTQEKMHVR